VSKLPWFAWYPADFERKTGHLSNEVVGAYVRLMNHYWSNNGQINFDPADLCRIMRTERRRFNHIWRYLDTFFVLQSGYDGDTLLLPRLQEELEKAIEISKTKAASGRKGGLASAKAKKKHTPPHTHTHINNNSYWVENDLKKEWAAFKKMRTSIKAPVNETAEKRIISKLESLKASGNDPAEVLSRSIENCWKGVFPLKDERNETGKQHHADLSTPADRNKAAGDKYFGSDNW